MRNKYIELKEKRDLGDIITLFFEFFKTNIKDFTSIFIKYNGLFILIFLGISYLLVTGFMGMAGNSFVFDNPDNVSSYMYIGFGILLLFISFIIVAALNYSLSSSYIIQYERDKNRDINHGAVWSRISGNLGNILLFLLLFILMYIGYIIVSFMMNLIPVLGMLVQYLIYYAMIAWLGVSFMVMLNENKSATDAFGEGWTLVTKSFWKCVGVNFIIGLLIAILIILILTIPGILIGIYTFHAVDSGMSITTSPVATIIYTLGTCIFLISIAYSQALAQFINGILYFSLHEEQYNVHTREKISQIGENE